MIMPGMNGYEVLKKKENSSIKVILTSGYSMQGEVQRVMDMGCDAFIQKAYSVNKLLNLVNVTINPDKSKSAETGS